MPAGSSEEPALIQRPGEVSESADAGVERLYRSHRLQLVRLALLLVDDRETAEDVVQDAFAALHRRWPALTSQQAAVGYLRTCVVNAARSVLRRRRTVRQNPLADGWPLTTEPADTRVLLAVEHQLVLDAIARLPERQREVILLRYWSGLGEAEIAATLHISIGAVKSNASRGRTAIATILGGAR
jgi:RNA polymerase sigma-70 factor (sigma-E family)